jgi:outer membrane receptor protein involved in Fe transport
MRRSIVAFACAWLLAAPVLAQEQRGSIEGVVRDSSGAVLPGATVEAVSATGGTFSTTSDAAGVYRFPAVPPGRYTVTATMSGFVTAKVEDVEVLLGQIKKVDFTLAVAGVAETVQVTAESPLIDVRQSTRSFSIRDEMIDKIPRGRDFSSIVVQAPGANSETRFGGGISIDGSSAAENSYIIDGIETTELVGGRQGKTLITDFIEEIQVKSSGYPAEFRGSTGGVINVITKSGTNDLSGAASTYFSGDSIETGRRPTLRLRLDNADLAEYITFPEDSWTRWEPGFGVGGPIARDRIWFFGSYQPALVSTDRTVTLLANNERLTRNQDQKIHYASGNITSQLSGAARLRVAANLNPSTTRGILPTLDGTDAPGTIYDIDTIRDNYTLTANLDYTATNRLFFGLRGGWFLSDMHNEGVPQGPRYWFRTSNLGMSGVPANLQRATGFMSPTTNFETRKDEMTRVQLQADATYFGSWGGQHALKAGVQIDRIGNDVDAGETGHQVQLFWNRTFSGQRGTFGYYRVRSNGLRPERGFLRQGDVHSNNVGLFIQDSWTIRDRLTLNLGLRTENERVPSFTTEGGIPSTAIEWGFGDKLAPRLGFAYDIRGDGRTKAYGSWGLFYDIMKLELPRGSFGGEHWLEYWYTLDTPDWTTLSRPGCPPACPGRLILGPVDFRHPSNAPGENTIDPDLDPMRLQEFVLGFEHELTPVMGIQIRYVHKQVDKAVEDVGALDAQQNEIYKIANPGFGTAATFAVAGTGEIKPFPKAVRDYDGVEFQFRKRFADRWALTLSYLWSRLWGNYSGLAQSDEPGRFSPNVGRVFDYPLMMFDERGRPVYGPLATDRPHQFKAQFLYDLPWGTSVGVNTFVESGIPVTREAAFIEGNNFPVMYKGRMSDGRNPVFSQTDLYLAHEFRLGAGQRLTLSLNVVNLFDQKTGLDKFRTQLASGFAVPVDEATFYRGIDTEAIIRAARIPLDPRFLQTDTFQGPLSARFGIRWSF